MRSLSLSQARRVALAAQCFAPGRPCAQPGPREAHRIIDRLALLQIDSVNVVARAHQLPLYSRLGPYDPALLTRAAERSPRRLFEFWGHAASLIDIELYPALCWRMSDAAARAYSSVSSLARERPDLVQRVLAEVQRRPLTARQIESDEARDRSDWGWNWSSVKTALEWLLYSGQVTVRARNAAFERVYDVPERVIPRRVLERRSDRAEAMRTLVARSARALGIAGERCLADYFRLDLADVRAAVAELEADGELQRVEVRGWERPTWLWHQARVPRRVAARALVSPFDSLVFERRRLLELFDCDYRIEIYVPEAKRRYGYYVYLFLLGEQIAARVDLKADRAGRTLLVRSAWRQPAAPDDVARELATELRLLAGWLGLERVRVEPVGDLAVDLDRASRQAESGDPGRRGEAPSAVGAPQEAGSTSPVLRALGEPDPRG